MRQWAVRLRSCFFFKQKTAYEMRISDWSSDVCSSDLAGLNDGLAFPFVYLGLLIAARGTDPSAWLSEWLLRDVLYRIAVGAGLGAAVGWLLGMTLFSTWGSSAIRKGGPGVIALAAVLLCYGIVELAEGYGFIEIGRAHV